MAEACCRAAESILPKSKRAGQSPPPFDFGDFGSLHRRGFDLAYRVLGLPLAGSYHDYGVVGRVLNRRIGGRGAATVLQVMEAPELR